MFLSSKLRKQIIIILSFCIIGIVGGLVGFYNQTKIYMGALIISTSDKIGEFKDLYDPTNFISKLDYNLNHQEEILKVCQINEQQSIVIDSKSLNKFSIIKFKHKDKKIISNCFDYITEHIKEYWHNETKDYINLKKTQKNRIDDLAKQDLTFHKNLNHNQRHVLERESLREKFDLIEYEINRLSDYRILMPYNYDIIEIQKKSIKICIMIGFLLGLTMGILFWQSKVLSFIRGHLKR